MSLYYNIVIFTASEKYYADPIIESLNRNNVIKHVLYRRDCYALRNGTFIKDLGIFDVGLDEIIAVDNSIINFGF